jgi:hypothetical protein
LPGAAGCGLHNPLRIDDWLMLNATEPTFCRIPKATKSQFSTQGWSLQPAGWNNQTLLTV